MATLFQSYTDEEFSQWLVKIRRSLHQIPETGFQEQETSLFIRRCLEEMGISSIRTIAHTGIIAETGDQSQGGPVIALRADIDGLPITEKTGLEFRSIHPGMMHACGHDGHIAMLLGAARLLKDLQLNGRVRFIFQPAEESVGGALKIIEEGGLDNVAAIYGGHIERHLKLGEIAVQPGIICAFTDRFSVTIRGKGGHGGKPQETTDTIVAAAAFVMNLQTLVSREINPSYPAVVSIGQIMGGSAPNVIAEKTVLDGTIRCTDPEIRSQLFNGIGRMVKGIQKLYQTTNEVVFTEGYPPIINHPVAADFAREAAEVSVSKQGVVGIPHPSLGGEDFSFYLQKVPGCFVRFGARLEDGMDFPAHSPFFNFNEDVLLLGANYLAQVAVIALARHHELDTYTDTVEPELEF